MNLIQDTEVPSKEDKQFGKYACTYVYTCMPRGSGKTSCSQAAEGPVLISPPQTGRKVLPLSTGNLGQATQPL